MPVPNDLKYFVYLCDWLPPDYAAVGQYSYLFARQIARKGNSVVLIGLTTGEPSEEVEIIGGGTLLTIKIRAKNYRRTAFLKRMLWAVSMNTRLVARAWTYMRRADTILFTGSPPLLLHWIVPANILLRKRLIHRITDFHPECLMAASQRPSIWLNMLYRLTLSLRRRVDEFEVLGEDQRVRLEQIGVRPERIRLKRDPSPVAVTSTTAALLRPQGCAGKLLLLYSGNWGVAHDIATFVEAYRRHHVSGSGRFVLWLNAVGSGAEKVGAILQAYELPLIRSEPVPLGSLASLLVTPDAHLITLSDAFVGFVLPSKVYGCIASNLPILFVGSRSSNVHYLCAEAAGPGYTRVDCGDVDASAAALDRIADFVAGNWTC